MAQMKAVYEIGGNYVTLKKIRTELQGNKTPRPASKHRGEQRNTEMSNETPLHSASIYLVGLLFFLMRVQVDDDQYQVNKYDAGG